MSEKGPLYGVELVESLPIDPNKPGALRQAMPSRLDLRAILNSQRCSDRTAAGYEILLRHWRAQAEEVERLRAIVDRLPKTADGVAVFVGCGIDRVWSVFDGEPYDLPLHHLEFEHDTTPDLVMIEDVAGYSDFLCECHSTREAAEAATTETTETTED